MGTGGVVLPAGDTWHSAKKKNSVMVSFCALFEIIGGSKCSWGASGENLDIVVECR